MHQPLMPDPRGSRHFSKSFEQLLKFHSHFKLCHLLNRKKCKDHLLKGGWDAAKFRTFVQLRYPRSNYFL